MFIDIIHTNDIHSNVRNFSKVSHYINKIRAENVNTLVLDAGDMITGEFQFTLNNGDLEAEIANIINYDAYILGNHEFDNGYNFVKEHMNKFNNKFIESNISNPEQYISNYTDFIIKNLGDHKIGLLGFSSPYIMMGYDSYPHFFEVSVLVELINKRALEVDKLIIISHLGYDFDLKLAKIGIPVDIIIGAHTHDEVEDNTFVNNTLIVQTGCFLSNLGHIKMNLEDGRVTSKKIYLDNYKEVDPVIEKILIQNEQNIADLNLEVFGRTKTKLEADRKISMEGSTNFGTLVCDSYMWYAKSVDIDLDFGIINSKGIRMSIYPGLISEREIFNALPFAKTMFILKVTGSQLKEAINNNIIDIQSSNLRIDKYKEYNDTIPNIVSKLYHLDGSELDDERIYKVMTVDYVYKSKYFEPLSQCEVIHESQIKDVEIVSNYIKTLIHNFEYKSNNLVRSINGDNDK